MAETTYWQRTDSFDQKMRLLEEAHRKKDFRLARSIADSLRISLTLEQQQQQPLGDTVLTASRDIAVTDLPSPWQAWAKGWRYARVLALDETVNLARSGEPIELVAAFPEERISSLRREVRVARATGGVLQEVRSQVDEEVRRGSSGNAASPSLPTRPRTSAPTGCCSTATRTQSCPTIRPT
ncbi:MAG: hypothetical protein R2724_01660 [Bryobacterales bacterium]